MRARERRGRAGQRTTRLEAVIGARVRELRLARNLSQADLARPLCSAAFISMLEGGKARPSLRTLEHISRRLGVRIADLLD